MTTLNLDRCLKDRYPLISKNQRITSISLAHNYLLEIPKFLSNLINLLEFDVNHNELHDAEFLLYEKSNSHEQYRPLIHPFLEKINLSYNHFKNLPNNLYYLRFLHTIDLSFNYLQQLPDDFGYLEQLKILNLNENSLKFLPLTFSSLEHLEYLNLSSNQFQSIDLIKNFQELKICHINSNPLKTFPILLNTCSNLEELSLVNIQLNHFDDIKFDYFESFEHLNKLDLSKNNLKNDFFFKRTFSIKSLEELYLQSNQISNIYSLISSIQSLVLLDLSSNLLMKIPECSNSNLKILNLSNNQIDLQANDCIHLKDLHQLDLSFNKIKQIPCEFLQCTNLQILNLSSNLFKYFPSILCQLRSLNQLIINSCQLSSLIKVDLLKKTFSRTLNILNLTNNNLRTNLYELTCLKALNYLDLSSNSLYELHENFRSLNCLKVFKLNHNQFTQIPFWFYQISNEQNHKYISETLLELHLSNNQLRILPEEILHMISLNTIDLSNNFFPSFPSSLVYLEQLTTLIYSQQNGRSINQLDDEFCYLINLKYLDLSHNTFDEIPSIIYTLTKLEYLNMNSNLLTALNTIGLKQLRNLKEIKLNNNSFPSFPSILYQYEHFHIQDNSNCFAPPNDFLQSQYTSAIANLFVEINDVYEEKLFDIYKQIFIDNLSNYDIENFLIRLKLSDKDNEEFRKNFHRMKRHEKLEHLFSIWKQKRTSLANADTLFKLAKLIGDKQLVQQMTKAYLLARRIRV